MGRVGGRNCRRRQEPFAQRRMGGHRHEEEDRLDRLDHRLNGLKGSFRQAAYSACSCGRKLLRRKIKKFLSLWKRNCLPACVKRIKCTLCESALNNNFRHFNKFWKQRERGLCLVLMVFIYHPNLHYLDPEAMS